MLLLANKINKGVYNKQEKNKTHCLICSEWNYNCVEITSQYSSVFFFYFLIFIITNTNKIITASSGSKRSPIFCVERRFILKGGKQVHEKQECRGFFLKNTIKKRNREYSPVDTHHEVFWVIVGVVGCCRLNELCPSHERSSPRDPEASP